MLSWQPHIWQLNHQKTRVCVDNLLAAILVTKGSRVLEKKMNETTGGPDVVCDLHT